MFLESDVNIQADLHLETLLSGVGAGQGGAEIPEDAMQSCRLGNVPE